MLYGKINEIQVYNNVKLYYIHIHAHVHCTLHTSVYTDTCTLTLTCTCVYTRTCTHTIYSRSSLSHRHFSSASSLSLLYSRSPLSHRHFSSASSLSPVLQVATLSQTLELSQLSLSPVLQVVTLSPPPMAKINERQVCIIIMLNCTIYIHFIHTGTCTLIVRVYTHTCSIYLLAS